MSGYAPLQSVEPYASIAPVYDCLVGDAGLEPIWQAFRRSCRLYGIRFASAADICCGTGRFLARLARTRSPPRRLYGIDRSAAMLAIARRRLAGSSVVLRQQDMARFVLASSVELLTSNFNVLNYLTAISALRSTIKQFATSLIFHGHLIFDILLSTGRMLPPLRQIISLPGVRARWDILPSADNGGATVRMDTCVRRFEDGWSCARELHVQRWWPLRTLERLLSSAGFRVLGVHRLIDHRPDGCGDRWVQVVARRC